MSLRRFLFAADESHGAGEHAQRNVLGKRLEGFRVRTRRGRAGTRESDAQESHSAIFNSASRLRPMRDAAMVSEGRPIPAAASAFIARRRRTRSNASFSLLGS